MDDVRYAIPFDDVEQARHVEHVAELDVDLLEEIPNEPLVAMAGEDDGPVSFLHEPAACFRAHYAHATGDQNLHSRSLLGGLSSHPCESCDPRFDPLSCLRNVHQPVSTSPGSGRAADGMTDAQGRGVDQHEGDAGAFVAAVGPGVIGPALNHDVARLHFTVELSMSISISPSSTIT